MPSQPPPATAVVTEVRHCLVFSHAFFDAFRAKGNRIRFWKFLVLVLNKTGQTKVIDDDFSWAELEAIVGEKITQTTYWRKGLVRKFKNNKRGPFLKRKKQTRSKSKKKQTLHQSSGRKRDITSFELSNNFDAACGTYLGVLANDPMGLGLTGSRLDGFLKQNNVEQFRKVVAFVQERYWPAWDTFLNEIGAAKANIDAFLKEMNKSATYWVTVLIAWERFETAPNEPYNQVGFYREVLAAQREIGGREVARCLRFLVQEGIFIERSRASEKPSFIFNEKHATPMRRYIATISAASEDFRRTFGAE